MAILKVLSVISGAGALAWFIYDPGFEPAIAVVAAVAAYIGARVVEGRREGTQSQTVSGSSVGIQAGRDVRIGNKNERR